METVSSYEARTRFGDLINRVYYGGIPIVIERYGVPVVKLLPIETAENKSKKGRVRARKATKKSGSSRKEALAKLMSFAGIWQNEDTERIKEEIYAWRSVPERPIPPLD